MKPILLEGRDLVRCGGQGGPTLLKGISLQLHAGDRYALVGKSGSGKSLLLRGLARLDPHTQGAVAFRDQNAESHGIPEFRRHVMYVTQHTTLLPGTVEDNLRMPFDLATRRSEAFDRDWIVARLNELARDEAYLSKPIAELSGGETRLVTLLRALQLQANVLLLDEPTSSLDDAAARVVEQLVSAWLDEVPERAYLWVTHSIEQAQRVAPCIWEMHQGQMTKMAT